MVSSGRTVLKLGVNVAWNCFMVNCRYVLVNCCYVPPLNIGEEKNMVIAMGIVDEVTPN